MSWKTEERYDSEELRRQVVYIADAVISAYDDSDDFDYWTKAYDVCAGHEWTIHHYKALRVCAENDTVDAEEIVNELELRLQGDTVGEHACAVVRELLHVAVLTELDDRGVEI